MDGASRAVDEYHARNLCATDTYPPILTGFRLTGFPQFCSPGAHKRTRTSAGCRRAAVRDSTADS